jgi:lysophospholipase L1-like esterase
VQSITPVSSDEEEKQPRLANSRSRRINNSIAQMALSKGMYFLDIQEVLADDTGCLRSDISASDGIHLNPSGYAEWADYLATHTAYSPYNAQFLIEGPYA